MSRRGTYYDTSPVENFSGSLKNELVQVTAAEVSQGHKTIAEYVERFDNCHACGKCPVIEPHESYFRY